MFNMPLTGLCFLCKGFNGLILHFDGFLVQVEREGIEGVGPKDHEIEVEGGGVLKDWVIHEDPGDGEEDEAAGGHVVERGDGVE